MPNVTTCTSCGACYEASSEECANDQWERLCASCREIKQRNAMERWDGYCWRLKRGLDQR